MHRTVLIFLALLLAPSLTSAQTTSAVSGKRAAAARVPSDSIQVDGHLDEAVWSRAEPVDDFVQKEPIEGAPPTERTEVRFLYDDDALYVGARMYSSQGRSGIQAPLSRRDAPYSPTRGSGGQGGGGGFVQGSSSSQDGAELSEYILVSLDTYLDRRTAYTFGVTASGVRIDHYHLTDSESNIDQRFDPVWEAAVSVDNGGWTAEMWIPFTQLRFNDRAEQVWGLNIHRWIPSKNEDDYWVPIPRTEDLWASRFGELRGIDQIGQNRRIEVLPYVTGGSTVTGNTQAASPFDDGVNLEGGAGADLKMGLGPNLTLDVTVTPDFGQVEVDPAVVNLTDTEVIFEERRPFFTEGSALLNGPTSNYFYSRRIGAPPEGRASGDFVDYPETTTILSAAKLTGRLPSGTSLGVLGAVTGMEHARTFDVESESFDKVRVAPRSYWGVARVQQEFGAAGSTASLIVTGAHRDLEPGEPLAQLLRRNALTVGGETFLRLDGGTYEVSLSGGMSYIDGDKEAILWAQRDKGADVTVVSRSGQTTADRPPRTLRMVPYSGSCRSRRRWLCWRAWARRTTIIALAASRGFHENSGGRWLANPVASSRRWATARSSPSR